VETADVEHSVILCLEYRDKYQTQGGCGAFYNSVLSNIDSFHKFKSRVRIIFTHNDAQFRGPFDDSEPFIEYFDTVDNREAVENFYSEIKASFFKDGPPSLPIFFISMKGISKLYQFEKDPIKQNKLRTRLLDSNSKTLAKVFNQEFPKFNMFDADRRFSFPELRKQVFSDIEKASEKNAENTLRMVAAFKNIVRAKLQEVQLSGSRDSHKDNIAIVQETWKTFERMLSHLAEETMANRTGIHICDLHFDEDEYCQRFHSEFPLGMHYSMPSQFISETEGQTLKRFLEIHKISLHYLNVNEMKKLLEKNVDGFTSKTLSLSGSYERMIDSMIVRLMSVQVVSSSCLLYGC
jgi:uncharacterized protein YktA (UPF0223 family)